MPIYFTVPKQFISMVSENLCSDFADDIINIIKEQKPNIIFLNFL